jgi:methionyl-tRNA synthetase
MKAILEFNLPDEEFDFKRATQGKYLYFAICEFDDELRNWIKHGHKFKGADEALNEIRSMLHRGLQDENISIHD